MAQFIGTAKQSRGGMRLPCPATPDLIGDGPAMTKGVVPRFSPGNYKNAQNWTRNQMVYQITEEVKEEWSRL